MLQYGVGKNELTYFVTAVSYALKMLIKLMPGANIIKLFTAVSYEFS